MHPPPVLDCARRAVQLRWISEPAPRQLRRMWPCRSEVMVTWWLVSICDVCRLFVDLASAMWARRGRRKEAEPLPAVRALHLPREDLPERPRSHQVTAAEVVECSRFEAGLRINGAANAPYATTASRSYRRRRPESSERRRHASRARQQALHSPTSDRARVQLGVFHLREWKSERRRIRFQQLEGSRR
jgi:hypothetical protein